MKKTLITLAIILVMATTAYADRIGLSLTLPLNPKRWAADGRITVYGELESRDRTSIYNDIDNSVTNNNHNGNETGGNGNNGGGNNGNGNNHSGHGDGTNPGQGNGNGGHNNGGTNNPGHGGGH